MLAWHRTWAAEENCWDTRLSEKANTANGPGYADMMDGIGSSGFALASSPPHGVEDGHANVIGARVGGIV